MDFGSGAVCLVGLRQVDNQDRLIQALLEVSLWKMEWIIPFRIMPLGGERG